MSVGRSLFILLGAVTASLGILAAFVPGLIDFSNPTYIIVTVLGVVALVQAVSAATDRLKSTEEAATTRVVERRDPVPIPGTAFDEGFGDLGAMGRMRGARRRDEVRDRLEHATVAVLTRYGGLTEEQARAQMKAGTWTDDVYAAAFFATDVDDGGFLGGFFSTSITSESTFQRRARHVIDALNRRLITEAR
ncbi:MULTISPECIES: hypothetical protein [unclassified Haladaptatus]|uniref:DUF7269 family protein n=1 Tax=unclassified Haladaptatus TaxID=2622732 RepID=UPI0023E76155|nr:MULTISPECIES: hypothetical protein [unclassified Haladaptatus]